MGRESHVVHAVLLAWGAHPRVRIARTNTGAAKIKGRWVRFGVPGTADICGLIAPAGRFLAIECKAGTSQSDDQKRFQRVVESMGGLYVLARSVDDVDRVLAPLGLTR